MIYLSFLLFLFPDIASRTICQEHDGDDDPHDEHCKQVKPQGPSLSGYSALDNLSGA